MIRVSTEVALSRTQEARSRAMRARLVSAAIESLEHDGFAGASVTRIIETAGVSRGAYLHHFRTKQLIYKAVADEIVHRVFRRLAASPPAHSAKPSERLRLLLHTIWEEVINGPEGRVYAELMQAARTDEIVAQHLRGPAFRALRIFGRAVARQFPTKQQTGLDSRDIVRLAQWFLRGMVLDAALSLDPKFFGQQIDLFADAMTPHLDGKVGR